MMTLPKLNTWDDYFNWMRERAAQSRAAETPTTGALLTLPAYTAECPERTATYYRLMNKGALSWDAQDEADWNAATGRTVAPLADTSMWSKPMTGRCL